MFKKVKRFIKKLGPGFVTGASDDDPSGIGTYSQTGAMFGHQQLWTSPFSLPFTVAIQEISGRIGMVTGKGLAKVIRMHYSKKTLYFAVSLLLIANTINIGANLGAMASSIQLLVPIPFAILLLLITATTLTLEVFVSYRTYTKYLKYFALSLFAYIAAMFVVKQDWSSIVRSTIFPQITFSGEYLLNIVAILGTTISPYLFFWEASEEVEEEVADGKIHEMDQGRPDISKKDLRDMQIDNFSGMFFSNIVMFFIIATTGSTLFVHGIHNIETAPQAAEALKPLAGNFAFLLFAIGIVGTGFLAVPILAGSASYALSEVFGFKAGLYKKFRQAHGFYGIISIATIIGLIINFTSIKPFTLLYYTAVLNGLAAPPILVLIMLISNNKKIMGEHTNSRKSNIFGWGITLIMSVTGAFLIFQFLKNGL